MTLRKENGEMRMNAELMKREKVCMRRQMLDRRAGLDKEYCMEADKGIVKQILQMEVYRQADVIFTYVSRENEVDTRKLICHAWADAKTVAVPRCGGRGLMKAYRIMNMEELEAGAYGILEPGRGCMEVRPEQIGLAVVPCVCCSEAGFRLGYGGGYYDQYLWGIQAVRTALCRERLIVRTIPVEDHDCAMDFVVTEERVLACGGRIGRG